MLCHCCGAVPLEAGHRFSVWFCQPCKHRIGLLNRRHGRCVVPIGPHGVHAGYLLPGDAFDNPVAVETFLDTMNHVFAASVLVGRWAAECVRHNLRSIGYDPSDVVDAEARFREMRTHLDREARAARSAAGGAS